MIKKFFICSLFFLSTTILAQETGQTRPLTEEEIQLIKEKMDEELLDGESARYKFPELIISKNGKYCGLVNGKNSYGAYTGYGAFLTMFYTRTDNGKTGLGLMLIDSGNGVVANMCREEGYQF